jgi:NAD(P)-dependent dehydrogenase (short-subunit alcohol dehydrogenase family)
MDQFQLNDKTILVTGGSSGIGRQTAITISQMGGKVIVSARRADELDKTLSMLSGDGHSKIVADLTDEAQIDQLVDQLNPIDGLVHSSGIVKPMPVKFINRKHIDEMYGINYIGPVLLTGKLFKKKKIAAGASIVFMSSISSHYAHKGGALYTGSKAGLNTYSKVIALEYSMKKIRSNVISAAMVKTPLFDEAEQAVTVEMMEKHGASYPLGFGEPEDVANTAVFLLSNASKWITGTHIVMDGGLTAGV